MGFSPRGTREGNAREFAAEVGGVAFAVLGVVQDCVDVVEDVPLGDGEVVVAGAELFEDPIGDVLAAVGSVFGIGVEGEALILFKGNIQRRYGVNRYRPEGLPISDSCNTQDGIFYL